MRPMLGLAALLTALCTGASLNAAGDQTAAARPLAAAALPLPASAPEVAPDSRPDRRILVMLHLPAEHYRPSADYGAAGGYGDAAAGEARKRLAAGWRARTASSWSATGRCRSSASTAW